MAAQKRVFFGSHFDFSSAAVDEVRARFNACIEGRHQCPFTSYDQPTKTFSFVCDHNDPLPVQLFLSTLKEYLEHEHGRLHLRDQELVDESPKIKPMEGTVLPEFYTLDDLATPEDRLIDHLEDGTSDSELDEEPSSAKPDGMASITQYWIPESGKINDLTTSVAQEIAQLTGSSLDPEPSRKRVRIYGGNFNEALHKLNNLEKLMELLAPQRFTKSPKASDNILILQNDDEDAAVEFVRLNPGSLPFFRILVDDSSREHLDRKCVGELRKRYVYNEPLAAPRNLYEIYHTKDNQEAKIWTDYKYPAIGHASSSYALIEPIVKPQEKDTSEGQLISNTSPSKYLTPNENMNIAKWTEDVMEPIDPGLAADPPVEEPSQTKRVRRLAESDDESSNDEKQSSNKIAPVETTRVLDQLVMGGSESARSISGDAIVLRPSARKRVVAASSTSSGSEEGGHENSQSLRPPLDHAESDLYQSAPSQDQPASIEQALQDTHRPVVNPQLMESRPVYPIAKTDRGPLVEMDPANGGIQTEVSPRQEGEHQAAVSASLPPPSASTGYTSDHSPNPFYVPQSRPLPAPSFPSTADFDPTKYGPKSKKSTVIKRGRGGAVAHNPQHVVERSQQIISIASRESQGGRVARNEVRPESGPDEINSKPSFVPAPGIPREKQQIHPARARGSGYRPTAQPHVRTLIEPLSTPITSIATEPPGFGIKFPSDPPNILDEPVEKIRRPSLQPASSPEPVSQADQDRQSGSTGSSGNGRYYINTHNPGLNITGIENNRLAALIRMQAKEKQQKQQVDESSTRRTYNVMDQKAPNPGLKQTKVESKQEKKARLAQTKIEAYGQTKSEGQQQASLTKIGSKSQASVPRGPAIKKKLPQPGNSLIMPEEKLRNQQTQKLITMLDPLFEASRAFPGKPKFDIQFGQALVPISNVELGRSYTARTWDDLFHPTRGVLPIPASFTNILTLNGADVDRLLETKAAPGKGSVKMWEGKNPGQEMITYDFHCQSKENEEFWLVVREDGTHIVQKENTTIGLVNLHYPGRVWDACAVLNGPMNWLSPSEETIAASAMFAKSLHVPADQTSAGITYRLPSSNEITIRNLLVKRTSLHQCLFDSRREIQLKVTETKTLYHRFNQKDKKLGQAFEKSFETMVQDGRIHYEASLAHTGINAILAKNGSLVLGDLTDKRTTGRRLLIHDKITDLLELTSSTVSKMDWMGAHNVGTLPRLEIAAAARGHSLGVPASRLSGSVMPASRITGMNTDKLVHGVRAGTKAEILSYDGRLYQRGYGGARVPLVVSSEDGLDGIGEEDVQPDDSASVVAVKKDSGLCQNRPTDPRARGPGFW